MSKEVLQKAVEKAIEGGYKTGKEWLEIIAQTDNETFMLNQANALIFNHDFAKSLWGEKKRPGVIFLPADIGFKQMEGETPDTFEATVKQEYVPEWMYHLQQMVIAEDPIAYLEENM